MTLTTKIYCSRQYFTSGALVLGVLQKLEYNYQIITIGGLLDNKT
jgi:hypothetical protein